MFPTLVSSFRPLVSCLRKPPAYAWAIFGLSVAIPLFFVFTTNQIWEDFFITYRFSENLARGLRRSAPVSSTAWSTPSANASTGSPRR